MIACFGSVIRHFQDWLADRAHHRTRRTARTPLGLPWQQCQRFPDTWAALVSLQVLSVVLHYSFAFEGSAFIVFLYDIQASSISSN